VAEALPLDGADVRLYRDCYNTDEAAELLQRLMDEIDWRTEHVQMFGRRVKAPRQVAWYGDGNYRYWGLDHPPRPLPPLLCVIRDRVAALTGAEYNGVLGNLYSDGDDSMGWHADDEPELGPAPVIASLSLGAARRFQFRRLDDKRQRIDVELAPASLLVMAGDTQRNWQHRLPKTRRALGPRINLTLRWTDVT